MNRGLYIHLPFCKKKCHYCDFVITTKRDPDFRARFFAALHNEVNHARKKYGKLAFDTMYWGGGTPSDLTVSEIESLSGKLHAEFDLSKITEFTIEANPGDVDSEKLTAFKRAGASRISLGTQAFQDSMLRDLGRIHTVSDISATVQKIRQAGFQNLSLDLMLRLPGQTMQDWEESLRCAISLQPEHISLYDLDLHPKTVYGSRERRGELPLPTEETHAEQFELAVRRLEEAGFRHYELVNFSKPGFESRHNQIYWHNEEYLGLGPGAFSYLGEVRYQTADSVNRYLEKTKAGDFVPDDAEAIPSDTKEWENLITGLRLAEGVAFDRFPYLAAQLQDKLAFLQTQKLLEIRSDRLYLSKSGRSVFESILKELR